MELEKQEWGVLHNDLLNEISKVKTFRVDCSTDGYGFKLYQNNSQLPITVQLSGSIKGGRFSNIFNFKKKLIIFSLPSEHC
jgi:hypothetical protein